MGARRVRRQPEDEQQAGGGSVRATTIVLSWTMSVNLAQSTKVDETLLDVSPNQLDANAIANVPDHRIPERCGLRPGDRLDAHTCPCQMRR